MMEFQENFPKSREIAARLQKFFSPGSLDRLALSTGFVKRDPVLTGPKFAQLCIGSVATDGLMLPLSGLCTEALKLGAPICEQSLNERFNERGVAFMEGLFQKALAQRFDRSGLEALAGFSKVMLEDSTTVELPGHLSDVFAGSGGYASAAALKVDCTYDLKSVSIDLLLRQGREPDGGMPLPGAIVPGSLWLRDLGYFNMDDLGRVGGEGAYFVSRLKSDVKVYLTGNEEGTPADLLEIKKAMAHGQTLDMQVFIGKEKRLPVRLVLQRVPEAVAKRKRSKLRAEKRKKGKALSQRRLEFCDLTVLVTNLGAGEWPPLSVIKLYKVRWQVEILFKVWKSVLKIGQVQKMKADRFLCLLYAQLLWAVVAMNIFNALKCHFWNMHGVEVSEIKGYRVIRLFCGAIMQAVQGNRRALYERAINGIFEAVGRYGKKQYRKGNPNPLFIFENS